MDVKNEPDSDIFEQYEKYLAVFSDTNVKHEQNDESSRRNSNYIGNIECESNKENIDANARGMCKNVDNNEEWEDNVSMKVGNTVNSIIETAGDVDHHTYKNIKREPNDVIIKTEHQDVDTEDCTHSEHAHTGERAIPEHIHTDGGAVPEHTNSGDRAILEHTHTGGGAILEHTYTEGAISIKDEVDIGPVVLQKTDLALMMQEIKHEPVNEQANIVAANTSKETQLLEVLSDTVPKEKHIEYRQKSKPTVEPQTHSGDYVEEQLNIYICDICGNNFKLKSSLRDHLKTHNPKVYEKTNGIYRCIECEVTSKWLGNIKKHYKQFHTEKRFTKHVCDICGNVFKNECNLKYHIQSKHNEPHLNPLVQKTVPCLQCSKVFSTSCYLRRHVDRCHLKRQDKECVICGTKFISQERYNKHIKSCKSQYKDTNISWQCDVCKKLYKNRQGVADHKRRYHSVSKMCNICGVSFSCQSSLNKHMVRAHLVLERHIGTESKFLKGIKCMKCPKMFGSKKNLKRHMATTCSNSPLINCDLCYKTFKCKTHASDHKSVHHKDLLPYSCDRCTHTFRRKDQITSHVMKCYKL